MNIQIHSVRFDADTKLLKFIKSKVKKLLQYNDDIIGAEVFLRLNKAQDAENKITEIARKKSKTFEEATDNAVDALKKQITKTKGKKRGV